MSVKVGPDDVLCSSEPCSASALAIRISISSVKSTVLCRVAVGLSGDRKPVEIDLVALDVFAGRHVLQEAGNGRIEAESPGLVEES